MSAKLNQGHIPRPNFAKHQSIFFTPLCRLRACPYCHPASSMGSMTSASPLPPQYLNDIQHSSWLAAFLDSSSPERGLTVMREPQEEEKKKLGVIITSSLCEYLLHGFSACWMWLYDLELARP